jgi:predicted nucleic acid-binding protein
MRAGREQRGRVGDLPAHRERLCAGVIQPRALPVAIGIDTARAVLSALRARAAHRFLTDDVSLGDGDVPTITGHRQVTDAHLLTLARRRGVRLVTFDTGVLALSQGRDVELLTVL